MIKLKPKTVILVISLSIILLSIPVFYSSGEPAIEEITPVSFDALGSDYYDIRTNSFETLKSTGKLQLTFEGSAELRVLLADSGGLEPDMLDIRLEGRDEWKTLSQSDWIHLGSFSDSGETVSYELRFSPDGNTEPGSYPVSLEFSLAQTGGGCYDPIIDITSQKLGPGEHLQLELTSSCGPVEDAEVDAGSAGVQDTGSNGRVNWGGGRVPEDEIDLSVDADGDDVKGLDGELELSLNLTEGDLEAYVMGSIGPGEELVMEILDQNGELIDTWTIYFDDNEGSDEIELEEEIEEEVGDQGTVKLKVEYEFTREDDD